jgi:phage gp45-like
VRTACLYLRPYRPVRQRERKIDVCNLGPRPYRLRGLATGDSALYDSRGAYLWLTPSGPAVGCAGNPMVITGDLHVTGAVIAGFGGGDQVGLQTHQHGTGSAAAGTVAPTAGT